jgi:hypothetical protein
MNAARPRRVHRDLASDLAGGDLAEVLAALLGRWAGRRRPAVLVALDLDPMLADVYPEDELLATFPTAPLIHAEGVREIGPDTLLVYVIDEEGETGYVIPDPRPSAATAGDHGPRPRRRDREVTRSG